MSNAVKNFDILAVIIILVILKIIFRCLIKFLDTSTKPFFLSLFN